MTAVVFVLVPGVHLLDLAGPAQVFFTAADYGCPYSLTYVADSPSVVSAQGVVLSASTAFPSSSVDDLVVVPGWRSPTLAGSGPLSSAGLAFLADHHAAGGVVASVCAGADALGRAGLLDGRHCTTHHDVQDELAARYPAARVVRDVLYVSDSRIVTSAGIASGIDMALSLVASSFGPGVAAQVARQMVVFARRNGSEPQASAMLRHRSHLSDVVHRAQDAIDASFATALPLPSLAASVSVSPRTLTRVFTAAVGMTPLQYQQMLRVERADHLILGGSTVAAAARAVGFEDARMLRRLRSERSERAIAVP